MTPYSVSTYSYHRLWQDGASVEDLLALTRDDGADGVEVLDVQLGARGVAIGDLSRFADDVVARLRSSPLPITSWACSAVFGGPGGPDETVARLRAAKDIARRLGARAVRVFSADANPHLPDPAAFSETVAGFRSVGSDALALENHGTRFGDPENLRRFIDEVPGLGLTLDIGNFWLSGHDPIVALNELAPYVRNVHLKDFTADREACALGEGVVPVRAALAALKERDAIRTLELEMPTDPSEKVRHSLAYCRAA